MAYALQMERSMGTELGRVVQEQVDLALSASEDRSDPPESVHTIRKCAKKIRGCVRLFRKSLGERYQLENDHYRDLARVLSPFRDQEVLIETLDKVLDETG